MQRKDGNLSMFPKSVQKLELSFVIVDCIKYGREHLLRWSLRNRQDAPTVAPALAPETVISSVKSFLFTLFRTGNQSGNLLRASAKADHLAERDGSREAEHGLPVTNPFVSGQEPCKRFDFMLLHCPPYGKKS